MRKIVAIAGLLFLFACSKEDNVESVSLLPGSALRYVKSGNGNILNEFTYDKSGNIQKRVSYFADKVSSAADMHYKNGRLASVDLKMDVSSSMTAPNYIYGRYDFEYDIAGNIIQQNHYTRKTAQEAYTLGSFSVFEYNSSRLPVRVSRFMPDGTKYQYVDYAYDMAGNVVSSELYAISEGAGEMQPVHKSIYQHDGKSNPYLKVYHPVENIPFSVNRNNITEIITTSYSGPVREHTASTVYGDFNSHSLPLWMEENGTRFSFEYN